MKKIVWGCAALTLCLALGGFEVLMMFSSSNSASAAETGPGAGLRAGAPVPSWVRSIVHRNAGQCPQVTESLLAAQLFSESGFHAKAKSPVGALGVAQFMPGTWAQYGLDGNRDGKKDVFDPEDAIAAQAHYDCVLAGEVKTVAGDSTDLMLAAYNAGSGSVLKYDGVPPYAETRGYVKSIRDLAEKWASAASPHPLPAGKGAARAIAAARTALRKWYRWGGSCTAPFTGADGCDCSSLVKMAWGKAGVNLPRTTYDQVHMGTAVQSVSQLRPGDLLFTIGSAARPEHVGMYIGGSQVIDAPHTGARVRIKPLSFWTPQILAMRHIG
ncbi:bifunctional lytic transglycosylase/C40 family peptidase [Streptomyces sp. DSM 41527]|uniref:Bifunctional lytic transglycosylase/C40 family peptidase n=1 Tax=Streptomyces mooreae TaxID=3075523 RepID=A0ABU2TE74_9ACTN|nr:bifunctional lytic transglycosylase/C40 family peptidase [Streptomyces sp. DSM 41527]MDT0459175.1 bifunctional lytic transglycosylase/C40 family peptidase [Streptomyces sp. DSM 41527]